MDGWIKIWYYDSIDNNSSDFVEVEPIYEFRIFEEVNGIDVNSMLMCIRKKNDDPEDSFWYAQDGNGGLWLIDLATMAAPQQPQKLLICHAGAVTDIAVCSWSSFLASCGDYQLNIYDYLKKTLIISYRFSDVCTQVLWAPCSVESTGSTLICSFASGVLRVLVVDFTKLSVFLVQITKPHTKRIQIMALNSSKSLLATSAEDSTIFIFKIIVDKNLKLEPVGYVSLPAVVNCLTWNSEDILMGYKEFVLRLKVPETRPAYTKINFELTESRLETFQIFDDKEDSSLEGLKDIIKIENLDDEVWLTSGGFVYGLKLPEDRTPCEVKSLKVKWKFFVGEISSWLFNEKFLILGLKTGAIKACNLANLSDNWILQIHENPNGKITKILISYDNNYLFSAGCDGNIFSFLTKNKTINFETATKLEFVEEVADIEDHLSLEEVIKKKEADRLLEEARKRKEEILATLEALRIEYNRIIERNNELPESQQLDPEELELDPRITEDLDRELKEKLEDVYRKSEFDLEKSRLSLEKLLDFYIRPLTCVPFAVSRILKSGAAVHSVEEKILGDEFERIYGKIQKEIMEIQINERKDEPGIEEESHNEFVEEDEEIKVEGVESFLKGLSPETIQNKLGAQINQMLRKYRERKARLAQRAQEWKIMHASKPDTEADNEEDVRAVEEARRTIGDYKLKISNDFEYNKDFKQKRDTTLSKYKQLLDCRKKTHLLREGFNDRLREVRNKKLNLQKEVAELIDKLKFIHSEIPEKHIKPLPNLLEINYDLEFPERNLEMEKYKSLAEKFNESRNKQYSKSSSESPGQINLVPKFYDEEYEILLLDQRMINSQINDPEIDSLRVSVKLEIPEDKIEEINSGGLEETPWELEMKLARVSKKIYQQDCIIGYIDKSYKEIDEELDKLEKERLEVQADSIYSELHQLTLQQELIVLREFQGKENLMIKKVDNGIYEQESVERKIQKLNSSIEIKKKEVLKINDKIKELNRQFASMISENKFSEYLKKIYRKKFKVNRITDESSESSSSDSSTDDNQLSTDDENFYHLTLDENTCPVGCDEDLYKSAFSMRAKRHELEARVRDDQKILEKFRKQLEHEKKTLKTIDNNLNSSRRELQDYLKEKQTKLNEIHVTVILKLHQLQHVKGDDLEKIRDCVVFDKSKLSQLYTRVGELQQDTTDQKIKHKKNRQHLHRVEIDCDYMESEIKRLKEEIKQEMIQKFGREVSLTSLYEAVLRRMVYDVKADMKEMIKSYDKEIKGAEEQYKKQVKVLEELIKENTEKLGLMTALEQERRKLKRIMKHKPENEENIKKVEKEHMEEIKRLEIILRNQRQQKELFRNEIRNLRLKSRPLPPVYRKSTKVLSLDEDFKFGDSLMENESYSDPKMEDEINREVQKFVREFDGDNCKELVEEMKNNSKIGKNLKSLEKINEILKNNLGDKYEEQNLMDIIFRLEAESETLAANLSLNWDVKSKIEELLSSLELKADLATVNSLLNYLHAENSDAAVDYLVGKLSSSDSEVNSAVRDYASKMLAEIKKCLTKN
ncbi:hypothetical protein KQX54_003166 [Cotesia glomerata]|uniref:WD repeat-containing protein 52 n=1 Tax=Cotesia glomerata TaxID=32391 RepID=A0AAV7HR49_COTGL|nr:hypothetical protein KQX54_003166 [Cotesia glomerata]